MTKNSLPIILLFLMGLLWVDLLYAKAPTAEITVDASQASAWPAQYTITLAVPPDHHAYLDKGQENIYIPVSFDGDGKLAGAGVAISKVGKPAGVYDGEVKATVLRGKGDFTLTLAATGTPPPNLALPVEYQLCNDVSHVCFRPQHTEAQLALPASAAPDSSASLSDRLLSLFHSNKDNTAVLFGLMLLAGLLSVATPCVYPMLPITSMFIINRAQGHADKEKHHAGAYAVGMVGTYILLGLMAGMTGGAFNTFMQSAWVNLAFAGFFAFFAIALLGFYELSFMQNEVHALDQKTSRVNGLGGTWLMGAVAGLVISPCVGPIVFALLLQVADNIAAKADALALANQALGFWDKFTIASQGGLMMGGFGLGVALPFFIVSVIKLKLPKAGYWMNKVKYGFGFMILYFAYLYFAKGMGVLEVDPATTKALAIGLVAIWIAVVHCHVLSLLPRDAMPNERMHHYCGVLALLVGGWLVSTGLGNLPFLGHAQAGLAVASNARPADAVVPKADTHIQQEAGIAWYRNFAEAQKVAQQTGKPLFIDFYASWCANCTAFKEETANNGALNQALREKAVAVKLVDKEPDFEKFRGHPEHRQLKIGLPYFAILSPEGKLTWSGTDYKATDKMVAVLAKGTI